MKPKLPMAWWLMRVKARLIHPDALRCTIGDPDAVLLVWWRAGFPPYKIANRLNERYSDGFLERKQAIESKSN